MSHSRPPGSADGIAANRKQVWSWAMYDWANSAFATVVMASFVPLLNKDWWNAGNDPTQSTFRLTLTISISGLVCALLAPMLGAMADRGRTRKRLLLIFASLGIVMTAGIHLAGKGQWLLGLSAYGMALAGFSAANIFYDSLLLHICPRGRLDSVSALGYSLGYIGGGLLFTLNVFMMMYPGTFGLADKTEAMRWGILTAAAWWALFFVPLLLWVPEPGSKEDHPKGTLGIIRSGFDDLRKTFHEIRALRTVAWFLAGYWFYIDGVNTVIKTAVDYGGSLGFDSRHLALALLVTQFVGFPAALAFGWIGERIGPKAGILIGLAVYGGVCLWGFSMHSVAEFYGLAIAVGLVQGGVQSLSRSLFARLIPPGKAGQFFGFYNMMGKFSTFLGPLVMGITAMLTKNPRTSILAIIALFVVGALCLTKVRPPNPDELTGEEDIQTDNPHAIT